VTCKLVPKTKKHKQRVVCTVRFSAPPSARAVARLTRNGRVYASGTVTAARAVSTLRLNARRAMPAGRYRLTLSVTDRSGHTVKTVRAVTLS
jgi:hypothetical protein